MPKYKLVFCLLSIFSATSARAADGPFGIAEGQKESELKVLGHNAGTLIYVVEPPKPNPTFQRYAVKLSTQFGVCAVIGMTNPMGVQDQLTSSGNLKSDFSEISDVLDRKYGQGQLTDTIRGHSMVNPDAKDKDAVNALESQWATFISQGFQEYKEEWVNTPEINGTNIDSILLDITQSKDDTITMHIVYHFSDEDRCDTETEKHKNDSL